MARCGLAAALFPLQWLFLAGLALYANTFLLCAAV